ncbi:uncharacterized protein Dwil_GK19249 [Drosophila willistoni]|uniref:Uncharacterized protein n=1 Tax=Drosophila willistoni TaxID=7260 RepID=B4N2J9_DROWI|nr:uncharacterized protein Dwil_GK19249 [Drosophila willistoni]
MQMMMMINNNHNKSKPRSRWPELNVANEQAIRFRCPQVGPQVGRGDLPTPQPMHFHHPQQLPHLPQLQPQPQIQQHHAAAAIKSKGKPRNQCQRQRQPKRKHQQQQQQSRVKSLEKPPALPARAPPAAAPPPPPPRIDVPPPPHEGELLPSTPDSPSLVTVSTWYTVAKQGVSC